MLEDKGKVEEEWIEASKTAVRAGMQANKIRVKKKSWKPELEKYWVVTRHGLTGYTCTTVGRVGAGRALRISAAVLSSLYDVCLQLALCLIHISHSTNTHQAPIPCIANGGNRTPEHGNWLLGRQREGCGEKNLTFLNVWSIDICIIHKQYTVSLWY